MKRVVAIVTFLAIMVCFVGCSKQEKQDKNLSGSYDIDQFLDLIKPANEARESAASEYDTDEEKAEKANKAYQETLEKIGFTEGMQFSVNGKLTMVIPGNNGSAHITLSNTDHSGSIPISGTYEDIGWLILLEDDTNIKVDFKVVPFERPDGGINLIFGEGQISSPARIDYKSNCDPIDMGADTLAMGEVVEMYEFTMTDKEIEDAMADDPANSSWYLAMEFSTMLIILQDEEGHQISAFIDTTYNTQTFDIGSKMAVTGYSHELSEDDPELPDMFIDTQIGGFYVFE